MLTFQCSTSLIPTYKLFLTTPPLTPLYFLPFLRVFILRFSWSSKGIIKVTWLTSFFQFDIALPLPDLLYVSKWQNRDSSSNFQLLHEALNSTFVPINVTTFPFHLGSSDADAIPTNQIRGPYCVWSPIRPSPHISEPVSHITKSPQQWDRIIEPVENSLFRLRFRITDRDSSILFPAALAVIF